MIASKIVNKYQKLGGHSLTQDSIKNILQHSTSVIYMKYSCKKVISRTSNACPRGFMQYHPRILIATTRAG